MSQDNILEIQKGVLARVDEEEKRCGHLAEVCLISNKNVRAARSQQEKGDAYLFAEKNRGRFIFNHALDEWMLFENHCWKVDEEKKSSQAVSCVVDDYCALYEQDAANACEAAKNKDTAMENKMLSEMKKTLLRISYLNHKVGTKNALWHASQSIKEPLSCTGNEFDSNPWLLACQNGIIDLKTGIIRDGRPVDFITLKCPVSMEDMPIPIFTKFISEIFEDNSEIISFIQRLLGYTLTGNVSEHIFPILYGEHGRNGKTTLIETLALILGKYSCKIKTEFLLNLRRNKNSGPDADTYSLKGARLAFITEWSRGGWLDQASSKALTGNDSITARPPYGTKNITWNPTHKLFLTTNERPHASSDDFALWERIILIPFRLKYVENPSKDYERKIDKQLPEKLKKELPGILHWLVQGCLAWQREGLKVPKQLLLSTEEYRVDEDVLKLFLDDITNPYGTARAGELFESYQGWCKSMNMKAMKGTSFGRQISKRYTKEKDKAGTYYKDLSLK